MYEYTAVQILAWTACTVHGSAGGGSGSTVGSVPARNRYGYFDWELLLSSMLRFIRPPYILAAVCSVTSTWMDGLKATILNQYIAEYRNLQKSDVYVVANRLPL